MHRLKDTSDASARSVMVRMLPSLPELGDRVKLIAGATEFDGVGVLDDAAAEIGLRIVYFAIRKCGLRRKSSAALPRAADSISCFGV